MILKEDKGIKISGMPPGAFQHDISLPGRFPNDYIEILTGILTGKH